MTLLQQETWRIIDQSTAGRDFDAKASFAIDDSLCAAIGAGQSPATMRSWVHHNTIVLGIQDTKLPHLQAGVYFLQQQGYNVIVRNSGGLAVVLDEGVLNISLLFPETDKGIEINRGYDAMYDLIQRMFADFPVEIEAREIVGSYCPGSYDLSINGQKFAGISQRRLRKGVAVQIYLCITGSGQERAATIGQFYERALQGEETKFVFPTIVPETMASLNELLHAELTVQDVMLRCYQQLHTLSNRLYQSALTVDEVTAYEDNWRRMVERNERALPFL